MIIQEIKGKPNFSSIIDLINAEWPLEFGAVDDETKIKEMENSFNNKTDTVKYLLEEDHIIGFYRYSLWPRDIENSKSAHTLDISIIPNSQKKGLGTFMMKDLLSDCRDKGIEKLLSRSFKSNIVSVKFHKSLGFSLKLETDDSYVWEIKP